MNIPSDRLLSESEVAKILGVKLDHLRRVLRLKIPHIRISSRVVRYSPENVLAAIKLMEVKPQTPIKAKAIVDHLTALMAVHGNLDVMTPSVGWAFMAPSIKLEHVMRLNPGDPNDERWTEVEPDHLDKKVFLIE